MMALVYTSINHLLSAAIH